MSVRKNVIAGWISHAVILLIGFFLMPYLLGVVGEAQYGAWLFINAVAGYSSMIYSGFGATICRYVAQAASKEEWPRLNSIVSSIQVVYVVTAALVLLFTGGFAFLAPLLQHWDELPMGEIQVSILIIGATIGFGMIGSVYGGVLIGMQRIDVQRNIETAMAVARLAATVLLVQERHGLVTLALIFFLMTVLEHVVSAICAYKLVPTLRVAPWRMRRDVLKECLGFSFFNAVALVAEYLIFFTDTVVIGFILGPLAVVPYQIGLRIAQMMRVPVIQVGEAVLPKAGALHVQNSYSQLASLIRKGMSLAFLLSAAFVIGATYFGEMLIETWMRRSYAPSYLVLILLGVSQVVALPLMIMRKALIGVGEVRRQAFIDLGEAALNLVLSLILIQYWGVVGVAWGTLIPLTIVELGVLLPYASRTLQMSPVDVLRSAVVPQVPALLVLLIFCETAHRFVPATGWLPLICVTAGGGAMLFGTFAATQRWRHLPLLCGLNRTPSEAVSG